MNLDNLSDLKRRLGFGVNLNSNDDRKRLTEIINAKLWFRGQPIVGDEEEFELLKLTRHLLANFRIVLAQIYLLKILIEDLDNL